MDLPLGTELNTLYQLSCEVFTLTELFLYLLFLVRPNRPVE